MKRTSVHVQGKTVTRSDQRKKRPRTHMTRSKETSMKRGDLEWIKAQRTRIAAVRLLLSSWSSSAARRRRFKCYSRTDARLFLSRYSCFKSLNCLAVCHRRIVLLVRHSTDRSILYRENIPRIGKGFLRKFAALNKPSDDTLRSGLTRCNGGSFIILYSVLCWIIEELLFNLHPSYFLNYIFSIIFDLIMF